MASCSSAGLVFLFALLSSATQTKVEATPINPLLPTCKSVGGGSRFVGIDFCMRALGSDSRSRNAKNDQDLAVIAVDLLTANVTSTAAKIDDLLQKRGGGSGGGEGATRMNKCLESCQALYRGIAGRQPGCAAAVKSGRYVEAIASLEQSASAAKECQDGFGKSSVPSPFTVENDNAFELAKLGVALLRH